MKSIGMIVVFGLCLHVGQAYGAVDAGVAKKPVAVKLAGKALDASKIASMAPGVATPRPGAKTPSMAASVAPSAKKTGEQDTWWKVLLGFLAKAGLSLASVLLPVLLGFAVRWLQNKLKLQQVEGTDKLLNSWVEMGIKYAEQQASKLDDNPDPKGAKLKLATDFVLKLAESSGLAKKVADLVEDRIESKLKETKGK